MQMWRAKKLTQKFISQKPFPSETSNPKKNNGARIILNFKRR